jgi:putative endonuclease
MAYREKTPAVYILASKRNGTIYTGVTSDLYIRMPQHKQGLIEGFTKKYHVHMLVCYEMHHLIESMNPEWIDLFDESTGEIRDGPADVARRKGWNASACPEVHGSRPIPACSLRSQAAPG